MFMEEQTEVAKEMSSEKEKSLQGQQISEKDISTAFKAVDLDKSGEISKRVKLNLT